MKKIIYIGNNLDSENPTTIIQLSELLIDVGYKIIVYSNKRNKLIRLIEMIKGVILHRKSNYLLIDTYSTLNFYFALVISQLARILRIKYIPILHGGNLPKRLSKNPFLSDLIFKNSRINIAPSNYLLKEFQRNGYKVKQIPNSLELNKYNFKKRTVLKPKILWVRAFDKVYNPLMAIRVLGYLKECFPDVKMCMIGADKDGSLEEVKLLAKEKNLLQSIEFTGFMSKDSWIRKSKDFDIFINTTTIDNTPVSVIEAMALGLPVVSTNVGGIPYLIENGKEGLLVKLNNEKDMVSAIIDLLKNSQLVEKITISARKKAVTFDSSIVKNQWVQILEDDY